MHLVLLTLRTWTRDPAMPIETIVTELPAPEPTGSLAPTVLIVTMRRWFSVARNSSRPSPGEIK